MLRPVFKEWKIKWGNNDFLFCVYIYSNDTFFGILLKKLYDLNTKIMIFRFYGFVFY